MTKLWKALLGTGCLLLVTGAPAPAIDLYGFGSYWDKGDAEGTWGAGIGISLPLITSISGSTAGYIFLKTVY